MMVIENHISILRGAVYMNGDKCSLEARYSSTLRLHPRI